jgi:hypothetical protein
MYFNNTELSLGTGFFYEDGGQYYLITNWHNAVGRNPSTLKLLNKDGAIPNRIVLSLNVKDKLGFWIEKEISLYSDTENKLPLWFVHPKFAQSTDVVAIPFIIPPEVAVYAVNNEDISKSSNMRITIAQDVFVLGYPRGLSGGGLLPIWKRATIATEPDIEVDELPKILVDTATREGMSGAPVFAISTGMYQDLQGNNMITGGGGVRFVGIYSGRNISSIEIEAQLGIVWKSEVIKEIIAAKQVGKSSFEM